MGGLITGISPCVLPVLPAIFFSGGIQDRPTGDDEPRDRRRPYLVVGGLALSFSIFTLLGTLILRALPLSDDVIRWAGLVVLLLLGLGMVIPRVESLLEKPFSRIPQRRVGTSRGSFVLGLALGAVYVPCAGPVLAAITVAGATGKIGYKTVVLTLTFAIGTSIPLLFFALAGRGVAERVKAFRRHQRRIRVVAGVVVIGLAVALTFNVTDALQRAVPDYTASVNNAIVRGGGLAKALGTKQNSSLSQCAEKSASTIQNCGAAPQIAGIAKWLDTPGDAPISLASLKGKVVLVDFWAYSCINCQRAIAHVEAWYQQYAKDGLVVVGVHTPEYAFEHVTSNVSAGAKRLGITYPVALDNDYTTWDNYSNESWPADYLIDSTGVVRYASIGEGEYSKAEGFIRQLLSAAKPGIALPAATEVADTTPTEAQSPETYLGSKRADSYAGVEPTGTGATGTFQYPGSVPVNEFALTGVWNVGDEALTSGKSAGIRLRFQARDVYLDVGGTGTVTATVNGKTTKYPVSGAPNIYPVVHSSDSLQTTLDLALSPGLSAYSFTFG
ncbi:MAG: alkyl hydroperoxide reductase/Thiol specific antioxidant/Mal allergen [Mycobacterium sp.]|nr:alkyl hydroperoxide reductase/Thiol specific antioxidant/Mal allergen [Mycobacterium sp.]